MSWPVMNLGKVCRFMTGGTPSTKHPEYYEDGDIHWIVSGDIHQGEIFDCKKSITKAGMNNSPAKFLPVNSVLIALNGQGKTRGTVALLRCEATCNQSVVSMAPINDEQLDYYYLFVVLRSMYQKLRNITGDKDRAGLNIGLLKEVEIPLPPLEEQKRIAAILDKADALRRKRQQVIDLTDQLLRSVFLDMFGDPVTNPKGFEVNPFSECIKGITGGWSTSGLARPAKDNEMGVLKISAVTSGQFISSENKAVEIVPKNKKLIIPKKGDLLFSRANTRELVAAMCIVDRDTENLFLPDKLWRIDLLMEQATNEYIKFLFAHPEFRNGLCKKATGTSGSMLNISKAKLMDHEIPLPPISLQKKFSEFFYKLQKQREDYTVALEHKIDLFSSLTQQAFRGELSSKKEAA